MAALINVQCSGMSPALAPSSSRASAACESHVLSSHWPRCPRPVYLRSSAPGQKSSGRLSYSAGLESSSSAELGRKRTFFVRAASEEKGGQSEKTSVAVSESSDEEKKRLEAKEEASSSNQQKGGLFGLGGNEGGGGGGGGGNDKDEKEALRMKVLAMTEFFGGEKVDMEDVKVLREKIFGYQSFWVTGQEPFGEGGEGVLFRGNLRGKKEEVFAKVRLGIQALFRDKYELYMVPEPDASEGESAFGGFGGGLSGEGSSSKESEPRVSFVLVRKEVTQEKPTGAWQYVLALLLAGITAGACLELGLATQIPKVPPEIIQYFTAPNPEGLDPPDPEVLVPFVQSALPVAYAVFGVQVFHEIAHRLVASRSKVKLSPPFYIPNITLGSFGAVTEFKTPCPDLTAKFDIALAGPLAAGLLSAAFFVFGLLLSSPSAYPGAADDLVPVPSILFQGSLLLGGACRQFFGYDAMHSATVSVHPLVIAGWCGLFTSALNLLPIGRLDGGRAMQAAFGRAAINTSSLVGYLLLGLGLIAEPFSLSFGILVLFLQRRVEKPALNDVSAISSSRKTLFIAILLLTTLTLLPIWPELADELGIGLGSSIL